jgi:hypothetical protein
MLYQCCINARLVHSPQTDATTTREQAMPEPTHYSYLLRLWREHSAAPWRVTLIGVAQPDERRHFGTLEDCFVFLHEQAAAPNEPGIRLDGTTSIVSQMDGAEK